MINPDALEAGPYPKNPLLKLVCERTIRLPEPEGGKPHPYYIDTGISRAGCYIVAINELLIVPTRV